MHESEESNCHRRGIQIGRRFAVDSRETEFRLRHDMASSLNRV